MTPAEINRRLALAIGYRQHDVFVIEPNVFVFRNLGHRPGHGWQKFDYREARTIYPIAERYKLMPGWSAWIEKWSIVMSNLRHPQRENYVANTCPRACVALAVIEMHERGLL